VNNTKSIDGRNDAAIEIILNASPASEGNRHGDAIRRLHQLRANGMGREEAVQAVARIYPPGTGKHRKVSIEEFYTAYDGAERLGLEPWATSRHDLGHYRRESSSSITGNKVVYTHDGSREEIPSDEIKYSFAEFLKFLGFRDAEYAFFATKEDAYGDIKFIQRKKGNLVGELTHKPPNECSEGDFLPSIDDYSGQGFSDLGTYFAVNPFKTEDSRKPDNISRFLYTMVESDTLSREEQLALFKRSGLPIKCLIDTGSKSVHAIIKVDAANADEYKDRVEQIQKYLGGKEAGFDSTQDAVRFSRLPNCELAKGRQRLISLECGATNWAEWEESVIDDGLPEELDLSELFEADIPEPQHIVQGFIRKGQVAIFAGASKTNKSWTMMELALAVSKGSKFLRWEANPSNVYYVDTELEKYDFRDRMKDIAAAKRLTIDKDEIKPLLLRGTKTNLDDLVPALSRRLRGKSYDLICIDAIYSVLGDREENSNEDIAEIGALLFELAKETGAAVVFTHHFSKGSQVGKRGIEKASGAGSWGRFPDVSLAIDKNPEEHCYNFETDTRVFAPQSSFVARRNGKIWEIVDGAKVERSTGTDKGGVNDVLDVLSNECGGECSPGDWAEACKASLGIQNRKTFDARKAKALKAGLIEQAGGTKNTICRLLAVKDPTTGQYRVRATQIVKTERGYGFEQE
jgi:RecA-family ATPase